MKATTLSSRNPELTQVIADMHQALDFIACNETDVGYLVSSEKAHNYFIAPPASTQPRYYDIHDAYSRPSGAKRAIWQGWIKAIRHIARMLNGDVDWSTVGLASRNSFNIVVCGDVVVDNTRYKLNITQTRVDIGICAA